MFIDDDKWALHQAESGIWHPPNAVPSVSYSKEGHSRCFELEDESFWFAHRNACISALLPTNPGPILDVGAGNGFVSRHLQQSGLDVWAVEPSATGAQNARVRGVKQVICATLAQCQFPAESFGVVGLFDVLEHIEDTLPVLFEVRRVLRKRGRVVVTVPAYEWLWSDSDITAGHFRRYTAGKLNAEFGAAGLKLEYSTHLFAPLVVPILISRTLRRSHGGTTERNEHVPSAWLKAGLGAAFAVEQMAVNRKFSVPFGSSILACAKFA